MTKKDFRKIIYSLHPMERKVLPWLGLSQISKIAEKSGLDEIEVSTAVQLLQNRGYSIYESKEDFYVGLDRFGEKFLKEGLPEIRFLKDIEKGPKKMSELSIGKDEFSSAIGILKRENLINVSKKDNEMFFEAKGNVEKYLRENQKNPLVCFKEPILKEKMNIEQKSVYEIFSKRQGFVKEFSKKTFFANYAGDGEEIAKEIQKSYLDLDLIEGVDTNMLKSGAWKDREFRYYDIAVETQIPEIGRRHPMIEANAILRDVFVEMGFAEMRGPMVESAFWNMDVMWIPQDHPARDEQDTFYLEGKAEIPKELSAKVKKMHEEGIKRTHTTLGDWSEDIASKRLLRTHSTSTSFRYLNELGKRLKKGENIEGKYFYVANVFRNEAVDATHLAEFFQAEGFIIADELSLADLMGFVRDYYAKFGLNKIRFKPTFNPYTEPSMEAHYYDEKMGKWYALINSGIFRPETLKPFGLENKRVIAWGIGASRVAALLARKDSMRDITGNTCDLEWIRTRPLMKREIVRK